MFVAKHICAQVSKTHANNKVSITRYPRDIVYQKDDTEITWFFEAIIQDSCRIIKTVPEFSENSAMGRFAQEWLYFGGLAQDNGHNILGASRKSGYIGGFAKVWSRFEALRARVLGKITNWRRNGHPRRLRRGCPPPSMSDLTNHSCAKLQHCWKTVLARSAP